MNHTKGEWQTYDGHDGQFYHEPYITIKPNATQGKAPTPIARIVDCGTDEGNRANAQLIASAPDLYEALNDCLNWLNEAHPDELYMRNILSKALAKAEVK